MTVAPTPRQEWKDAVWEDGSLRSAEKLVALAFEKYAGAGIDSVWVERAELARVTGMGRSTAVAHVQALVEAGWLTVTAPARQHRSTEYRLTVPRPPETSSPESGRLESGGPASYPRRPDIKSQTSRSQTQTTRTSKNPDPVGLEKVELVAFLEREGLRGEDLQDLLNISSADPDTGSALSRLAKVPVHRHQAIEELKRRKRSAAERALATQPKCDICHRTEQACRRAEEKVPADERHQFTVAAA